MIGKSKSYRERENASRRAGVPKECRSGHQGRHDSSWSIPAKLNFMLDGFLYPHTLERGRREVFYRNSYDMRHVP